MKKIIQTTLVATCLFLFLACSSQAGKEHTTDSLETIKKNVSGKKAFLLDVREEAEWKEGHLEKAIFLPLSQLRKGMTEKELSAKINKKKIVYTHCRSGYRSVVAANLLKKKGYDVRALKAGYVDLLKAGFEKAKK